MKYIITAFAGLTLILSQPASAFETPAQQAMLFDATTGNVLYAKAADERMGPSSMSKIMTVYIVFDRLKKGELTMEDTFFVSEKAWRKGGSKMFVNVNDQVAVGDLLRGVIVQSGNDASIVLAEGIAGSEEAFAQLMNQYAKELGLSGSHFANATGWPDEQHYMTARDLVTLSVAMIRNFPELYKMWDERDFTYHGITQPNRNSLLGAMGVDGLKTGHTEAAGYGIVTSAEEGGRRLVSVVNGLDSIKERISASRQLLTYGFKNFKVISLFKAKETVTTAPVWAGEAKEVALVSQQPLLLSVPTLQKDQPKVQAVYSKPIVAPIKAGDVIGKVVITSADSETLMAPLVAANDVERAGSVSRIWSNLKYRILGN